MRLIEKCPMNCSSVLFPSKIILPEGVLLKCSVCGQLVSQCDRGTYTRHMARFNENDLMDRNLRAHTRRLKKVQKYAAPSPPETRLLDVGCSIGLFLKCAEEQGYVVTGVDPAANAAQTAVESGLDVKAGFLQELDLPESCYDIITLFEVIEHVADPIELLKECHRILKRGGFLFITTGNADGWTANFLKENWDYFDIKLGHVSFFNPASLYELAKRSGFRIIKLKTKAVRIRQSKRLGSGAEYTIAKVLDELLNLPAKVFNKGQDVFLVLRKEVN